LIPPAGRRDWRSCWAGSPAGSAGWSHADTPGRWFLGLLADLPRRNCWTIAEHAGQATPDGLQHLLAGAVWDHDGIRDDIRDYLLEHLADPQAVLVVDETGDLKKGTHTVGVQRQYCEDGGARRPRAWSDSRQYRLRASPVICRPGSEAVSRHHRVGVVSL